MSCPNCNCYNCNESYRRNPQTPSERNKFNLSGKLQSLLFRMGIEKAKGDMMFEVNALSDEDVIFLLNSQSKRPLLQFIYNHRLRWTRFLRLPDWDRYDRAMRAMEHYLDLSQKDRGIEAPEPDEFDEPDDFDDFDEVEERYCVLGPDGKTTLCGKYFASSLYVSFDDLFRMPKDTLLCKGCAELMRDATERRT